MATRILRMNGDIEPLGKARVQKYIQRNPRVKSVVGRPMEAARVNGGTATADSKYTPGEHMEYG